MVRRACVAVIAGLTVSTGAGCHLGPQPRPSRPEPPIVRRDPAAERFVAQHNRNAEAIRSLRAEPRVQVSAEKSGRVDGQLALERDRYFCLDLYAFGHHKASIGSNPDEFWFWIDDDKDKAVNFCQYTDVSRSALTLTYQPDWIIEAMGLRPITAAEARTLAVRAGDTPNTMVLTQTRKDAQGQTYTKETVVDESTSRILEHRLWLGVKQQLLASAKITNYVKTPITEPGDEPTGASAEPMFTYVPERFRLEWVQEKFALDINLRPSSRSRFQVNPRFDEKQRADLFSEPKIAGTVRRDLARLDLDPNAPDAGGMAGSGTHVRETRPMPSRGISLGDPIPDTGGPGSDGAVRTSIEPDLPPLDSSANPARPAGSTPSPTGWTSPRRRIFGSR